MITPPTRSTPLLPPTTAASDSLPSWMRPRPRRIDWGFLIVLAFGVFCAWAQIVRPGFPRDTQAIMHAYRAHEVAQLVRGGVFYSRWAPYFNFGYGSPLFNYLAPLPHYLPGYHQAITEAPAPTSIKLFLMLSILAAGTGIYRFSRGRWGALAGVVAALLYLFSPPLLYTLPYLTGELGLLMALGLLPWAMWGLDWVQSNQHRRGVLLTVLILTTFLLTDSRVVALSIPMLLWSVISGSIDAPRRLIFPLVVILAAVLLTAFFWLPALTERDQVNWVSVGTDPLAGDISPTEAFAAPPGYDPELVNPLPTRSIGFVTWIMALAGIAATLVIRRHGAETIDTIGFMLIGLLAFLASLPFAGENGPSSTFLPVLPYHTLLIALFCFCLLGAQVGRALDMLREQFEWRIAGVVGVCLFPLLAALPMLYPPAWGNNNLAISTTTMLGEEMPGYHNATLREGLLLPGTLREPPFPSPRLIEDLRANAFTRILPAGLSADSSLDSVEEGALNSTYRFVSKQPVRVEWYLLNWAGWAVSLEGRALPTETTEKGLLRVYLPTDFLPIVESLNSPTGMVSLYLADTPIRRLSGLLFMAGLVSLIAVARWQRLRIQPDDIEPPAPLRRVELWTLLLILGGWGALTVWVHNDPTAITTTHTRTEIQSLRRLWEGGVDLLGFGMTTDVVRPGGSLPLTLYWQAARPVLSTYQSEVALVNAAGEVVATATHRHPGGIPSIRWSLRRTVRDPFLLAVPPTVPPGDYTLRVRLGACNLPRLTPCETVQSLESSDEMGRVERGTVTIPILVRVVA